MSLGKILYLGPIDPHSTARHRGEALRRIGCEVVFANPLEGAADALKGQLRASLHFKTGYRFLQGPMRRWCEKATARTPGVDVIWVDGGELLGPACVRILGRLGRPVVLFNVDDPTGRRDGRRFDQLRATLPFYTLAVTVRNETEIEMRELGCLRVLKVWRSYDEVMHAPFDRREEIAPEMRSEVAFIGTWMRHENRDQFLAELLDRGVPLSIWGSRWQKSRCWPALAKAWRGPNIGGRDYVSAIQGAKISIGLLSKGNRDLHTQRSAEIPYAGGLFCAQRTIEHEELYRDGEQAIFWDSAEECAERCRELLADDARRERIRLAGMRRVRDLGIGNEDVVRKVLAALER